MINARVAGAHRCANDHNLALHVVYIIFYCIILALLNSAVCIKHTEFKANHRGAYICAKVNVGDVRRTTRRYHPSDMNTICDAVYFEHPYGGDEYCVRDANYIEQWIVVVNQDDSVLQAASSERNNLTDRFCEAKYDHDASNILIKHNLKLEQWTISKDKNKYSIPITIHAYSLERSSRGRVTLCIKVIEVGTCQPISRAAVDIWHCDAIELYSHFVNVSLGGRPQNTDNSTVLRGTFKSIRNVRWQCCYPDPVEGGGGPPSVESDSSTNLPTSTLKARGNAGTVVNFTVVLFFFFCQYNVSNTVFSASAYRK
ncbi:unnamed protein product [Adineta ricciae]|uniref:Uncharacterized protein n=1 Tax=Adineta ricciae TaxID=249248 RepID=A0A815QRB3_ADIRI|nr:unnamed protein product [Adineta ricciae]CAF1467068.1 unnamed protein product [Adineta ricciae]